MPQRNAGLGRFVGYELAPIAQFDDGTFEPKPSMAMARSMSDATCWALYGLTPEADLLPIGKFCDYALAAEIYTRITGHIVPENPRAERMFDLPNGV
jgi:hypothetical protein